MRKVLALAFAVSAFTAAAAAQSALAATPTLSLAGICTYQTYGGADHDWFNVEVTGTGYEPGTPVLVAITNSYNDFTSFGPGNVQPDGSLLVGGFGIGFPAATRTVETITFAATAFLDVDGDYHLDADETVLATATTSLTCPLRLSSTIDELTETGALSEGTAQSLESKLHASAAAAAAGNTEAAINQLEAFIREVRSRVRAGQLDATAGERLIAEAQARIDALRAG